MTSEKNFLYEAKVKSVNNAKNEIWSKASGRTQAGPSVLCQGSERDYIYVKRNSAKANIVVPEIKNYGCLPKREMLDRRGF